MGRIGTLAAISFALAAAASPAVAADRPRYGPPGEWVLPLPIPRLGATADGSAAQVLLADTQARFSSDGDETYNETAVRLLTPQAVAGMASLTFPWNPDTQTLTIHRLAILREDRTIDLLASGRAVTVLRRETSLETAMLDGELTATVQPQGLRVGDVVDIAFSIVRRDPVLRGRSEGLTGLAHRGLAGRVHIREIWPDAKSIRWRATEGLPPVTVSHVGGQTELVVDAVNLAAPKPPVDAPARFGDVGQLEISQFKSWAEVSGLMAPLYAKATHVAPDSPLQREIARIAGSAGGPKARAEAALRLAQDQIHYVFLGMNFGGYIPAEAGLTWSRRFGDCKGKTALLLALLAGLGVEAQPALVSTGLGDGLDQRLPRLSLFDHVVVRAVIDGKTYWLDPTRVGDRDLDETPPPNFHWVLPVQAENAVLEKVDPPPLAEPAFESLERLDATAGYDVPAPAHLEHVFRGDAAVQWRLSLEGDGRADAERRLREYWRGRLDWIEPKSVAYTFDDAHRVTRLTMDGLAKMDWAANGTLREFDVADSNLGFTSAFQREPGPHADAPFSVRYPSFDKWSVRVVLPAKGAEFRLAGAPPEVDETVAGRHYVRHARLDAGVVTVVTEERSLVPEFPAAQARSAATALRTLSRFNVVVRGPGGPTPARPDDELAMIQPTDAKSFELRGAGYLGRGEDDKAIADFTEAARLEPKAARHLYDRGVAWFHKGERQHALGDFDAALALEPGDISALMGRADVLMTEGALSRADADWAAALRLSPDPPAVFRRRAEANEKAGRFEAAVRDYDAASAAGPLATARAGLLNARCFARAEWGQELEKALADCQAALLLMPADPDILDSQGFVHLRLGRFASAIADYDAGLAAALTNPTSFFGRGLAKLALGRVDEGEADLKAARAAAPDIDARFARCGVTAPPAHPPRDK